MPRNQEPKQWAGCRADDGDKNNNNNNDNIQHDRLYHNPVIMVCKPLPSAVNR